MPERAMNQGLAVPENSADSSNSLLRASLEASRDYKPEQLVKARTASEGLGRPEPLVRDTLEESLLELKARRLENNKELAGWTAQSPQNASWVNDDTEAMDDLFKKIVAGRDILSLRDVNARRVQEYGTIVQRKPGLFASLPELLVEGGQNLQDAMRGFTLMAAETLERNLPVDTLQTAQEVLPGAPEGYIQELAGGLRKFAEAQREAYRQEALRRPAPLQFDMTAQQYIAAFVRLIPQIGAQIGMAAVTGSASSMVFMGSQISGGQYLDLTEEEGVSKERALLASLANAAIQAPLEAIGLSKTLGLGASVASRAGRKAVAGNVVKAVFTEPLTEFLQQYPEAATNIWAKAERDGKSIGEVVDEFIERLPETAKEGLYEAALALPVGLLGGGGRLAAERRAARMGDALRDMHQSAQSTRLAQLSPEMMQEALEQNGVNNTLYIPAKDMLAYYQADPVIAAEEFGISPDAVATAAALGQDVEVEVARITSRIKDATRFNSILEIARPEIGAMNLREARDEEAEAGEMQTLMERQQERQSAEGEYEAELDRFRADLSQAVSETKMAGQEGDADGILALYRGFAERHYPDPKTRAEFVRRLRIQGPQGALLSTDPMAASEQAARLDAMLSDQDALALPVGAEPLPDLRELGDLLTEEEYGQLRAQQDLMAEMGITSDMSAMQRARILNPWLDAVWGRLEGASLRTTYPDAFKEIVRNYGIGIFRSRERGGQAVDTLADELVRENIFQQNMGADELVELLKQPARTELFQSDVAAADESLRRDVEAWGKSVDGYTGRTLNRTSPVTMLRQTPLVLQMLGAKNLPVSTSYGVLDKVISGKHKLTPELVKQVPAAMADPVMVFRSDSMGGDLVMMLDLKNAQGATIVVPVALGQKGARGYSLNIVPSMYAKNFEDTGAPRNRWFADQIARGNLLYRNNKKSREWAGSVGLQLPAGGTPSSTAINKIYTDADFVKLREANPALYQRQQPGARGSLEISRESYLINLFDKANISTLIHETAHVFDAELRRLEASGLADEAMRADRAALDKWLARFDNDATLAEEYKKRIKGLPGFGKVFEKLNANEKERAREVARREYFARGFEAYVREGKAPSEELRQVFSRFMRWLLQIYKKATTLGVELNDEVRGVFGRMLATETEIERTAAFNELVALTQKELDALGAKGPEREYQAALLEAAKRKAVDKAGQARNRDRAERLKAWAEEARAELLQNPVYAARQELYGDGFLDADAIAEIYGRDALNNLRRSAGPGVARAGGQSPEIFAARHGFGDGAEMLAAITGAEGLGKRVKAMVSAREAAYDAAIDPVPFLLETEEAAAALEATAEYLARNLKKEALARRAFALVAGRQLAGMNMKAAIQEGRFTSAMRRALREERLAIGKGDFAAALEANTQARINMELARQARELSDLRGATERNAKRFVKMTKADPAARFFVNDIAARFGLMPYDNRLIEGKDAGTIANWLAAREDEGFAILAGDMVMHGQASWQSLAVQDFQAVSEAIAQVITVERNSRKLLTAADKASFTEAVDGAVDTIFTYREQKPVRTIEEGSLVARGLREAHAAHTKIEALLVAMDGGKFIGKNWELVYKPVNDAENRRGIMFKELAERLKGQELFGAYSERELSDMSRKKVFEPAAGESLTKGQRIMVALNMGNEGNYTRLLEGRNWTEDQAAAVVEPLDERDWKFVQGIWDTFESYKAESFALQEEVTGQRPSSVEARPVRTKHGDFRGGYFPVAYDQKHVAADLQEKLITDNSPAFAMTRHGHLKERNSRGAGTPLDLNMSVIPARLNDVITDLCFRRAYIDVGRVLKNRKYRNAVESTVGHEQYQAMVYWLKDAAKVSRPRDVGESLAQWARSSATMMSMGYKFTTMLAQPFGITQSTELIGYANVMKGLNMAYGKGVRATLETSAWVKSVSPFMAQRLKSFDRDVADATADFARKSLTPDSLVSELSTKAGLRRFEKWTKEHAFVPMGVIQYGVDLPTWLGAYQKGLGDLGGSEARAREYADSVVRLSQGGGQNKDLARIQRGSQYHKMFTMFYSYFNTLYNLTALRAADVNMRRDAASVIRAANSFLLLYAIPAVLTEMAAGRGPDDDEEFLAWSAKQLMMYPMQAIVGVRTLAGAIEGEFRYKASPAESAPESFYNFAVALNKALTDEDYEVDVKKLSKVSMRAFGYFAGLPLGQAEISAFNVWDYLDGTSGDFEFRDLFYRRQKSRR